MQNNAYFRGVIFPEGGGVSLMVYVPGDANNPVLIPKEACGDYTDQISDLYATIVDDLSAAFIGAAFEEADDVPPGGEEVAVDGIVGAWVDNGSLKLGVQWAGHDVPTWESAVNCANADVLINGFLERLLNN